MVSVVAASSQAPRPIAFLGPLGTYSHLVASKRFGRGVELMPLAGVADVCRWVSRHPGALGVIPIENSSGGAINETVDILLDNRPRVYVVEELALDVKLALLGREGYPVRRLHSHFVPLEHCAGWIGRHLGRVETRAEASTALAAAHVTIDPHAAALGGRHLARQFGLDVLAFPVESDTPNITTFVVVTGRKPAPAPSAKITLSVRLPNDPGSLYRFLGVFEERAVNLSRLVSRPVRGVPGQYAFLVDLEGDITTPPVRRALAEARRRSEALRVCGAFPRGRTYRS